MYFNNELIICCDLMSKEVKTNLIAFLILLFITFLFSFPYLNVGLERDEGSYFLIASKILRGSVPYKDITENKPIALYFFLTLPAYLLGNWINGLRVFGFIIIALTAFIIFLIGKKLIDIEFGFLSAFIFIFLQLFTPRMLGFLILSETISNLFVVLVVYLVLSKKLSPTIIFLIGLLSSVAFLIRQTSLFLVIIIPIYIYYNRRKQKFNFIWYFLSGITLIIAIFVIYLFLNSALEDAFYHTFLSMSDPYGPYATYDIEGGSLTSTKFYALFYFIFDKLAITVLMLIGVMNLKNIKDKFILLWFLVSLIFAQISPSIYLHYYIITLPALSLLVGIGCTRILEFGKIFYKNKNIYYLFTLISIVALAILLIAQFSYFAPYPIFAMNGGKAYVDTFSYNDEIALTNMLKNTSEDERIFVFPAEPQVYYLTGKDPISKMPLFNDVWFAYADYNQLNKFLLQPLSEEKPKYIIIANNIHFEYINKTKNGRLFMQYVNKYYHLSSEIGIAQIYEMN
jgi:4-amino-4-deoxy-L-arabinose transferase-like glycosyltransferase